MAVYLQSLYISIFHLRMETKSLTTLRIAVKQESGASDAKHKAPYK